MRGDVPRQDDVLGLWVDLLHRRVQGLDEAVRGIAARRRRLESALFHNEEHAKFATKSSAFVGLQKSLFGKCAGNPKNYALCVGGSPKKTYQNDPKSK